jgi:hypothetical protein
LGLGISDDTVLRQLKRRAQDTAAPPTVIGIDDWSWRKSQTYGTIIDILEDRDVVEHRFAIPVLRGANAMPSQGLTVRHYAAAICFLGS